jgi:hypothetical protein
VVGADGEDQSRRLAPDRRHGFAHACELPRDAERGGVAEPPVPVLDGRPEVTNRARRAPDHHHFLSDGLQGRLRHGEDRGDLFMSDGPGDDRLPS